MYGEAKSAQSAGYSDEAKNARPMPELGRLKSATERVANARRGLETFLDRFNGPLPETNQASGSGPPCTDSYRNDLESLFIQIERLENLVSGLDHIG